MSLIIFTNERFTTVSLDLFPSDKLDRDVSLLISEYYNQQAVKYSWVNTMQNYLGAFIQIKCKCYISIIHNLLFFFYEHVSELF